MNTLEFIKRTAGRFQVPALGVTIALLVTASAFAQPLVSDPVYPAGLDAAMLARLVDWTTKLNGKPLSQSSFTVSGDGKTLTGTGGPVAVSEKTRVVYDRVEL